MTLCVKWPMVDKRTVVHLITGLGQGGAERALLALVRAMDDERFTNIVVPMTGGGKLEGAFRESGIRVESLGMRGAVSLPAAYFALRRLLDHEKVDLLQSWMYHADLLGTVALFGRKERPPQLWNIRASTLERNDHAGSLFAIIGLLARLSKRPAAVVANAAAGVSWHTEAGYLPRRWAPIPNGIDTVRLAPDGESRQAMRASWGVGESDVVVGMVARVHPMKDFPLLIEAACKTVEKRPNARFVIVGEGTEAGGPLDDLVEKSRLDDRLIRLGGRSDVERVYHGFDLATSTSYSEGFPNVVAEAMACGVTCVATDAGETATIIGDTGVVTPVRNVDALTAAYIGAIDQGNDARRDAGGRARQRIVDHFSVEQMARRYETLYEEILGDVTER